jgi:hypothetical protein
MRLIVSISKTTPEKGRQIVEQLIRACRKKLVFPVEICGVRAKVKVDGQTRVVLDVEGDDVIIFDEQDRTREQVRQGNAILALLYADAVKKGDMSDGMKLHELQEAFDDDAVPVLVEALVRQGLAVKLRDVIGLTPAGVDIVVEP